MSNNEDKQELLHTELVKYGVNYQKAAKAAQILADKKADELLTEEEITLTKEVCEAWLKQRQRLSLIERELG
ncbi:MAG: hypothetical protein KME32_25685 [Mojavia pulchra JT2-VF2]|jgi:hypothetical protein|uniref:Uncharacterized protein n=1 Tax=Mojavia pulchra JT2-VF2 TaxID=287848 RepID=A0A951UIW0_9NOST|nr:hypothetical protein [Mojavia pulchra JT2-VF2]